MKIHQTAEDYWALKAKGRNWKKILVVLAWAIVIMVLSAYVRGQDVWSEPFVLTSVKIGVFKTAGIKNDPNATVPVGKATVALYDGIIEDIKGGTLRISAPTDTDGMIEFGLQPGLYTVIVTVDGEIKDCVSGRYRWPVVSTLNAPDVCFFVFK